MKVFFSFTSDISVITFYLEYLKFLNSRGVELVVAANFRSEANVYEVEKTGATVINIPFYREPKPFYDLVALVSTMKAIKQTRPDIVVYATPKASLLTAIASSLLRVPRRIYQLWGMRLETAKGTMRRILLWSEKTIFHLSTEVISVSKSLSIVAMNLNLGTDIKIIGSGSSHGVNIHKFSNDKRKFIVPKEYSSALSRNEGSYFVTLIARLSRDKGVDTFIDSIRLLRQTSEAPVGVLVGEIEDQSISLMIEQAISEGIIIHIPQTEDVRPYMVYASVNSLPSLREGLPNVILEASAMGVPSVVSASTGCVDAVVHNVTGIILEQLDASSLAEAISDIASSPQKRLNMSKAGVNFVTKHFESQIVLAQNFEYLFGRTQVETN